MALPTKEKTWQYNVNQVLPLEGTNENTCRRFLYTLKQSLKTFGSSPWTVVASSGYKGGTTWTCDSSDNWDVISALQWNFSGNRSWIVLAQSGLGTSTAICISLGYYPGYEPYCYVHMFPTGIGTPGSLTARPTATDEFELLSGTSENYGGAYGTGNTTRTVLNVMQSTDGECTRVVACRQNSSVALWIFDKVKDPIAAWTWPVVSGIYATSAAAQDYPIYGYWNDSNARLRSRISGDWCNFYITSEGYYNNMLGENFIVPDDDTGEWPLCPMGLACTTSGHMGARKGVIRDLWWGPTALYNGDTLPADGSKTFAVFGDMIFPWDGSSVPKMA